MLVLDFQLFHLIVKSKELKWKMKYDDDKIHEQ
jgi:hypothetical protein